MTPLPGGGRKLCVNIGIVKIPKLSSWLTPPYAPYIFICGFQIISVVNGTYPVNRSQKG